MLDFIKSYTIQPQVIIPFFEGGLAMNELENNEGEKSISFSSATNNEWRTSPLQNNTSSFGCFWKSVAGVGVLSTLLIVAGLSMGKEGTNVLNAGLMLALVAAGGTLVGCGCDPRNPMDILTMKPR